MMERIDSSPPSAPDYNKKFILLRPLLLTPSFKPPATSQKLPFFNDFLSNLIFNFLKKVFAQFSLQIKIF